VVRVTKIELKLSEKHKKYKGTIKKFFGQRYKNSYLELVEVYTASDYLDTLAVFEYEFEERKNLEYTYRIYLKEILSHS